MYVDRGLKRVPMSEFRSMHPDHDPRVRLARFPRSFDTAELPVVEVAGVATEAMTAGQYTAAVAALTALITAWQDDRQDGFEGDAGQLAA
jgi:hypothetical protein